MTKGPVQREDEETPHRAHAALTHLNHAGEVHMVGVTAKPTTVRRAVATASLRMKPETLAQLWSGGTPKGDALATARIAGIQAAKRTWEIIPLCHPVKITAAAIDIDVDPKSTAKQAMVRVRATVDAFDQTGVEMEAMVAASTAALALYDMLKAVDRWMTIATVELVEKSGGRSGHHKREAAAT
jgi:cyclic pyranopterin phosphate synthase